MINILTLLLLLIFSTCISISYSDGKINGYVYYMLQIIGIVSAWCVFIYL